MRKATTKTTKTTTKKIKIIENNIPTEKSYAVYHIFSHGTRHGMIRLHDYDESTKFVKMERVIGDMPDMEEVAEFCEQIYGNPMSEESSGYDGQ